MSYWKDSHKAVEKPLSQKLYLQWGVWKLAYNFHISRWSVAMQIPPASNVGHVTRKQWRKRFI